MYIIYLTLSLSALYSVYRWRVARLRNENIILEEKVRLRTSELQQANHEIEAQRDLVTKQKEHIEEIHKEVTDSIHYAKRLQTSAIPGLKELREQFADMFILFKPKDVVSGDFYWYAKCGNNIVFTVADCTGHGVPGAFMSILGISLLKEIVIKGGLTRPDMILNLLRDEIIKALGQTGAPGEQKDGMDISICSVNKETLQLQWAGANLPCLIVRDGIMTELKGDKMPIAIYEKMERFTLQEFRLQGNDIIYLSGDGYHDQFGGPQNKKFMSKRFKELLVSISGRSMEEQKEILNETIEDWETGYETRYEQTDDITVMGLKV
jgi:serine phosphatase RsbU (regulator of sigma subunit)